MTASLPKTTVCLMFGGDQHGKAEEAIRFYTSLLPNSALLELERHEPGQQELEGTVKRAVFTLDGQPYIAMDGGRMHAFTFTPALSVCVQCNTEPEIERLTQQLAEGGTFLMPLDRYPFAAQFAWVHDRFGVSWQLTRA
jgi:predicted 3-demethylubiquinone-9 3-methyltransferase (glyoxalase superfamily)